MPTNTEVSLRPTVKLPKIVICLYKDAIDPDAEYFLDKVRLKNWAVYRFQGTANVDISRSLACEAALGLGAEKIFWFDSDMVMEPDQLLVLDEAMDATGHSLISAMASRRGSDSPACSVFEHPIRHVGEIVPVVTGAGCACLLTHRRVYETLAKDHYTEPVATQGHEFRPWFQKDYHWFNESGKWLGLLGETNGRPEGGRLYWVSEDMSFCIRAKMSGFKTYVHTGVQIGHKTPHVYYPDWKKADPSLNKKKTLKFPEPTPTQTQESDPEKPRVPHGLEAPSSSHAASSQAEACPPHRALEE